MSIPDKLVLRHILGHFSTTVHDHYIRKFADLIPYIAYDDVMKSRYIIRGQPPGVTNSNNSESREIIVECANLDELVNVGWRLNE